MMTVHDMMCEANLARHEGRHEDAAQWTSLFMLISRIEAAARLAERRSDDVQFDYEREAEAQGVNIRELMR